MQTGTATANVTITHHILPDYINLGTGAIIGLAQTIAGILILVFGKISDIYGLMEAAKATAFLCLIAVFISLGVSKKYQHLEVKPEPVK